jgi:hypothetical protein
MYNAHEEHADAIYRWALGAGVVSVVVDRDAFRRLLWERCMTGEQLRRELGLSPSTLAKFYAGGRVRDDIFAAVVHDLERRPVSRVAQELTGSLGRPEEAVAG